MYETRYPAGQYSDVKDFFALAIDCARRAGLNEEVERLISPPAAAELAAVVIGDRS